MQQILKNVQHHKMKYLINTVVSLLFLFPFFWIISTSLKTPSDISTYPPKWIPGNITLQNYKELLSFEGGVFSTYFFNSLFVTAVTIFFVVTISSLAGYGFSKLDLTLKSLFFFLILM